VVWESLNGQFPDGERGGAVRAALWAVRTVTPETRVKLDRPAPPDGVQWTQAMVATLIPTGPRKTPRISHSLSAWGEALKLEQETADRYGFTQRENDAESGLMHFRARGYDPRTGRFIQTDPLNPIPDHYRYVTNSPVSLRDPEGLQELDITPDKAPERDARLDQGGYSFKFLLKKTNAKDLQVIQFVTRQTFYLQKNQETHEIQKSLLRVDTLIETWRRADNEANDYQMQTISWPPAGNWLTAANIDRVDAIVEIRTGTFVLGNTTISDEQIDREGAPARIPGKAPEDASQVFPLFIRTAFVPFGKDPVAQERGAKERVQSESILGSTKFRWAMIYAWDRTSRKELLAYFTLGKGEEFGPQLVKAKELEKDPSKMEFLKRPDVSISGDLK